MAVGGKVNFEVDDGTFIGQGENCEMCKKREHDGYCSQCEIYICQVCFDLHLNSKLCRDHVLLHDADNSKIQDSGVRFDSCSEHKHQEVRLYCTEHKCCGCVECILLQHSSCKWDYIVEASNRFQNSGDLARLLEDVQSLDYTLDKYMEAIDKHTKTAETINTDALSDIETFAKSLVEYVAGSKQQALVEAKVRESAHQQKLDKLRVDIQSLGSQVEEIITDFRAEDVLHKRFILAVQTMPKVARIQNEIAAIDCNNVITDYTFRPGNFLKRMMSNTLPIGRLIDASDKDDDDEDTKLKKERERSLGLEQQLKENQGTISKLKQELDDMKLKQGPIVILPCGHENLAIQLGVVGRLIECRTCGIITGDQPNGTFTTYNEEGCIQLNFKFPNGTQSKLNRNPGLPYSGKRVTGFLINDTEGTVILKMLKVVFERKCLFTVGNHGNIQNVVELYTYKVFFLKKYSEYIVRVRQQLAERGIKESDVTQL